MENTLDFGTIDIEKIKKNGEEWDKTHNYPPYYDEVGLLEFKEQYIYPNEHIEIIGTWKRDKIGENFTFYKLEI